MFSSFSCPYLPFTSSEMMRITSLLSRGFERWAGVQAGFLCGDAVFAFAVLFSPATDFPHIVPAVLRSSTLFFVFAVLCV
jgi:hypothetical protein